MQPVQTEDLRIQSIDGVLAPLQLHLEYPISDRAATTVHQTRHDIARVLRILLDL